MKITQHKTADLIPYARNARQHDDAQVAKIAGSIREFGFTNPVLIAKDKTIIAGHGRVLAAQKLGLAEVPCVVLDHLTDTQRRAYMLADNRLAEIGGGWDMDQLKIELEELSAEEIDLDALGFGDDFGWARKNKEASPNNEFASIPTVMEVICECESENHQQQAYDLLTEKGFKCRLSTF